jgi:hypothetical protein
VPFFFLCCPRWRPPQHTHSAWVRIHRFLVHCLTSPPPLCLLQKWVGNPSAVTLQPRIRTGEGKSRCAYSWPRHKGPLNHDLAVPPQGTQWKGGWARQPQGHSAAARNNPVKLRYRARPRPQYCNTTSCSFLPAFPPMRATLQDSPILLGLVRDLHGVEW